MISFFIKLLTAGALIVPNFALAVDVGTLTVNGFVKIESSRASNQGSDCQLVPGEARHRPWADDIANGKSYGTSSGQVSLAQSYIGFAL